MHHRFALILLFVSSCVELLCLLMCVCHKLCPIPPFSSVPFSFNPFSRSASLFGTHYHHPPPFSLCSPVGVFVLLSEAVSVPFLSKCSLGRTCSCCKCLSPSFLCVYVTSDAPSVHQFIVSHFSCRHSSGFTFRCPSSSPLFSPHSSLFSLSIASPRSSSYFCSSCCIC